MSQVGVTNKKSVKSCLSS